jgi:hypothetical protein
MQSQFCEAGTVPLVQNHLDVPHSLFVRRDFKAQHCAGLSWSTDETLQHSQGSVYCAGRLTTSTEVLDQGVGTDGYHDLGDEARGSAYVPAVVVVGRKSLEDGQATLAAACYLINVGGAKSFSFLKSEQNSSYMLWTCGGGLREHMHWMAPGNWARWM